MHDRSQEFDAEVARLQGLLAALEGFGDPAVKTAARELVQVVIRMHGLGLADLLAIVQEADSQPADTLLPKFAANPRVHGLLLLHDLHPEDLETRARKAVERLRPHLGVQGVHVEFTGVQDKVVRIRVSAVSQNGNANQLPATAPLRREVGDALLEMAPDAADLIIEGLDATGALELSVPLTWVPQARAGLK